MSFEQLRRVWPVLDERQRRLMAAALAQGLGRGGRALVARELGLSRSTITAGLRELDGEVNAGPGRVRARGGGRPKAPTVIGS
jgi:hypothetical protein